MKTPNTSRRVAWFLFPLFASICSFSTTFAANTSGYPPSRYEQNSDSVRNFNRNPPYVTVKNPSQVPDYVEVPSVDSKPVQVPSNLKEPEYPDYPDYPKDPKEPIPDQEPDYPVQDPKQPIPDQEPDYPLPDQEPDYPIPDQEPGYPPNLPDGPDCNGKAFFIINKALGPKFGLTFDRRINDLVLLPLVRSPDQIWFIFPGKLGYRLTPVSFGFKFSLDTYGDTFEPFISPAGYFSGQFWRFIPRSPKLVSFSNTYLGPHVNLTVLPDQRVRMLPFKGLPSQVWNLVEAGHCR